MKSVIILCLVAAALAAPQRSRVNYSNDNIQILRFDIDNNIGDGRYKFGFEQTDGQRRDEVGEIKNEGSENEYQVVKGSYSWVGPDGVTYTVTYVADENGFQPEIEQGPGGAVPAHIATLLG